MTMLYTGGKKVKRKYGDRSNWPRVLKRDYQQTFQEDENFRGYITLLSFKKITEPLKVKNGEKEVCLLNSGYSWLQQFPLGKNHCVTTMFNEKGKIVQWYIDICYDIGTEKCIPWMDDLYLDIVVMPSGEVILMDEDELDEALATGVINKSMYEVAWKEAREIMNLIQQRKFELINQSKAHKEIVSKQDLFRIE